MTEERITKTEDSEGNTHTTTTVIRDSHQPASRGGLGKIFMLILAISVIAGAIYAFNTIGGAEMAKDNAVADAAGEVGDAAQQVGDAAQDAADTVTGE